MSMEPLKNDNKEIRLDNQLPISLNPPPPPPPPPKKNKKQKQSKNKTKQNKTKQTNKQKQKTTTTTTNKQRTDQCALTIMTYDWTARHGLLIKKTTDQ